MRLMRRLWNRSTAIQSGEMVLEGGEPPPAHPQNLVRALRLRNALLVAGLCILGVLAICQALKMNDFTKRITGNEWSGWVGYREADSPNFNDRPEFTIVDCIVLHSTAQHSLGATVQVFEDPNSHVSAHFVVGKDGTVVQMVPLTKRAWHAGTSRLDGVDGVNDYSIGIEMSNLDNGRDPYPLSQYKAVAEIIRRCRKHYYIPDNRIVSHAEIALPPGRKDDPLGFNIPKLIKLADSKS